MHLSLLCERARPRIVRFGLLCFCVIAVTSAISHILFQGSQASLTSDVAGTLTPQKSQVHAGLDSTTGRDQANVLPAAFQSYGKLPLSFEINRGQTNPEVKFMARGQGYGLFLTSSGAVLRFAQPANHESVDQTKPANERVQEPSSSRGGTVTMRFNGSRSVSHPVGLDKLPGKSNYFIGNKP